MGAHDCFLVFKVPPHPLRRAFNDVEDDIAKVAGHARPMRRVAALRNKASATRPFVPPHFGRLDGKIARCDRSDPRATLKRPHSDRSDERRIGKECVSTCRSRWAPTNKKKKKKK